MKALKILGLVLCCLILVGIIFVAIEACVSLFNGMPLGEQLKYALINLGDWFKKPFIK